MIFKIMSNNNFVQKEEKYDFFLLFWILIITLIAGYTNAFSLQHLGETVSHHTGHLTNIGILSDKFVLSIKSVIAYFFGAFLSGLSFGNPDLKYKRRYGFLFFFVGILDFIMFYNLNFLNIYILAFEMGLQNSFVLHVNNLLVRTTHMTGYITDFGFSLGALFRNDTDKSLHKFRIYFYGASIFSFVIGAVLEAKIFQFDTKYSILLLAILNLVAAFIYHQIRNQKMNKS